MLRATEQAPNMRAITIPDAYKKSPKIIGRWRITQMEQWDRDYFDQEVEAFIEFESRSMGSFQFGLVQGEINYRITERDGKAAVEWTFEGMDKLDPVCGRAWAKLSDSKTLEGRIFLHNGDDSGFSAKRK